LTEEEKVEGIFLGEDDHIGLCIARSQTCCGFVPFSFTDQEADLFWSKFRKILHRQYDLPKKSGPIKIKGGRFFLNFKMTQPGIKSQDKKPAPFFSEKGFRQLEFTRRCKDDRNPKGLTTQYCKIVDGALRNPERTARLHKKFFSIYLCLSPAGNAKKGMVFIRVDIILSRTT
jgi:hypothetical protein